MESNAGIIGSFYGVCQRRVIENGGQFDHDGILFGEATCMNGNHLNISYILKSLVASCLCMAEF